MIKSIKSLSIAEAGEIVSKLPETEKTKAFVTYVKKFVKINGEEARKLRQELTALNIAKLNDRITTKIVDMLPEDVEDLRKICLDVQLDENEIAKILGIVKKY